MVEKSINPSADLALEFKGKPVVVRELTMQDIYALIGLIGELQTLSKATVADVAAKALPLVITGLAVDDLFAAKPSELKRLWAAIAEVNAVFFAISDSVGLTKLKNQLLQAIQNDFAQAILRKVATPSS